MSKKIMIVDDEEDIRNTVRMLLEKKGYEVETAINADDCMKKLKKYKPDLILMDIMMPGTSVIDVVDKIKGVKIAYLTVVRASELEKKSVKGESNIVDYIQKPFEIKELLKRVANILGE